MLVRCADCSKSNGTIEKDGKLYECMCATLKRVASSMPPYIKQAVVQQGHLQFPIVRQFNKNYYIRATWEDLKAMIKLVMVLNSNKLVRLTSDREIRDIYVGSKSRKSIGDDTESEVINTLEELMDKPHLVVIKTNELYYKNKAAPGALEESISYRLERDKPTWVFTDIHKPFGKGSHAWSESVDELLRTGFGYIEVPIINNHSVEDEYNNTHRHLSVINSSPTMSLPVPSEAPKVPSVRKSKPVKLDVLSIDDEETVEYGAGIGSKKKRSLPFKKYDEDEDDNPLAQYGAGLTQSKKKKSKFERDS